MNNLQFIKRLCKGSSCYSDHMDDRSIQLIHIESGTEDLVRDCISQHRMLFITGNPGDGKTYLIKALNADIADNDVESVPDVNSVRDLHALALHLSKLWREHRGCVVAVNEFPFLQLLKEIKQVDEEMHAVLFRQHSLSRVLATTIQHDSSIVVIDLNNRNLLATERGMPEKIVQTLLALLAPHRGENRQLDQNIRALSEEYVQHQLNLLFSLVEITGKHFSMREIMEAISFMLTSCVPYDEQAEDEQGLPYYDAIFAGGNALLDQLTTFDPAYVSLPELDEALWNGEQNDDWGFGEPTKYPYQCEGLTDALTLFKSIKRKYFFENSQSTVIADSILDEYKDCQHMFSTFNTRKTEHLRKLISGLNRLYISGSSCDDRLQLWTVHNYDQTREPRAAICRRHIPRRELEITVPVLPDWLKRMEYTPNCIVLSLKGRDEAPRLTIDIDFLRVLFRVNLGYPLCLVPPEYLKALRVFSSRLVAYNEQQAGRDQFIEENEDIVISNRTTGYKQHVTILDDKLSLGGGAE